MVAVAVSAASGALASGALAAGTDPLLMGPRLGTLANVVAPVQGRLVRGDRIRIRVKTDPGVRSFRAWLGSREISRSFSRAGGARIAVVRTGKRSPLELGVNRLYVRVRDGRGRRDFDYVRFVRARPRSSLLRLRPVPVRARGGRVPVRLRLGGRAVRVRAWLNGRRLRSLGSGRVRRLALDGDRGLRFGRNTIRLVGIDERGSFDLERLAVRVGRDHPIPAAGRNRRVKVRHPVRLDARGSTAAHRRSRLGYRWRIVQRPKGSKAKLRRARRARPRLRPDRVGTYRVRLLLSERPTEGARGSAAATHARDTVTLSAGPNVPPIGLPITVLADPGGDIRLGTTPPTIIPPRGLGVAVWVFDRSDLSFQARLARAFTPDVPGMQALAQYLGGLNSSQLVIVAAPPGKSSSIQVQDPSAVSFLNEALAEIGAPSPVQGSVPNPPPQGFSAIGVPGMPCCEAPINPGLTPAGLDGAPGVNGALSGYLQLDHANNYTIVSADYVPYNTVAAGTTDTQAVITVGGNTYTSQALSPGQTSGFFLLILDAGSLRPVVADTQPVSVDSSLDPSVAANGIQELANRLTSVQGDPSKLVFLQSIGQVQRGDAPSLQSAWNSFASAQSQIGGNGLYLNSLDPSLGVRSYSYVGPVPPSNETGSQWSATASAVSTLTGGQLSGLLARNPISQYYPKLSGTVPDAQTDLPTVVFQPPTPWPNRATAGQKQAIDCIAAALDLTAPIEANYINENLNFGDLGSKLDDVEFASLSSVPACQSVTDDEFEPAKTQIVTEFDYVGNVWQFIGNLQKPLLADASTVTANLTDIAQAINNTIKPPNNNTLANGEQLISAFMYLGSALPGAGEVLSLDGAMFGLAGELANEASGANELQGDVTVQADSLGDILAGQFQDAYVEIDTIGEMLVSDWGKLQTTFQKETGEWAWTSQTTQDLADAATGSAQRLVYEALFPLVYTLYRFGDQHVSYAGEYSCFGVPLSVGNFYPFANEPEGGNATIIGAGPTTDVWAFGKIDQDFLQQNVNFRDPNGTPPQSLYNSMFVTPVSSSLNAPAIPTQQRFMLDVYGSPPHTITRDELDECLVDGNLPPG